MTTPEPKYQLLDPLTEQQYTDLKEDIAERGILTPVIVDEFGEVIDGHHRRQIAEELGKDYPIHRLSAGKSEADKLEASLALNLMGRRQTKEQKQETIKRYLRRCPDASGRRVGRLFGVDNKTVERIRAKLVATEEIPQSETRLAADGRTMRLPSGRKPSTPAKPDPEAVAKRQADLEAQRAKAQAKQAPKHAEQQAQEEKWRADIEARGGSLREVSKPPARILATQDRIKAAMNDCALALTRALQDPGLDVDLMRAEQSVATDYRITAVHERLKKLVKEFGDKLKELKAAEKASAKAAGSPVREQ